MQNLVERARGRIAASRGLPIDARRALREAWREGAV
jgi:hypothetical protein